jgi:hypothetical protein
MSPSRVRSGVVGLLAQEHLAVLLHRLPRAAGAVPTGVCRARKAATVTTTWRARGHPSKLRESLDRGIDRLSISKEEVANERNSEANVI